MPAPHQRRTRPHDPRDRDRLDQRPKPLPVIRHATGGPAFIVVMQGDFGRYLKIFGLVVVAFMTGGRFVASEPLPFVIAVFAGCLAIVAVLMSIAGSANRIEFVAANQFTDKDEFKRQSNDHAHCRSCRGRYLGSLAWFFPRSVRLVVNQPCGRNAALCACTQVQTLENESTAQRLGKVTRLGHLIGTETTISVNSPS